MSCVLILPVTVGTFARIVICLTKCLFSIVSDEENIPVLIKVLLHYIEGAKGSRKRVCIFTFHFVPLRTASVSGSRMVVLIYIYMCYAEAALVEIRW